MQRQWGAGLWWGACCQGTESPTACPLVALLHCFLLPTWCLVVLRWGLDALGTFDPGGGTSQPCASPLSGPPLPPMLLSNVPTPLSAQHLECCATRPPSLLCHGQ